MIRQHRFVKEQSQWYIDLPEYLESGGSKGDLQMVAGADTMLDIIASGANEVTLHLDTEPFENADELRLTELCDPILGGGYYHLELFEGKKVQQDMWLCEVTRFVFNDIPQWIYVRRVGN
jgi:hypothetical protein